MTNQNTLLGICSDRVKYKMRNLVEGEDQRLKSGKVADELEDPHYPHHPHQPHNFPCFPHNLNVLGNGLVIILADKEGSKEGKQIKTCIPVMTRSRKNGTMAQKSTRFMGWLGREVNALVDH